jgi:AcrR family transcriptional regulator
MARPSNTAVKRQEIIQHSIGCFTRNGYHKTTLEDVAKEVNINKATLYHYFKNKEALFLQVMLEVSSTGIAALKTRTMRIRTTPKKILFFFAERLDFYLQVIRLNGLTREHLFTLQAFFEQVYLPEKELEIVFIAGLMREQYPGLTLRQAQRHARLCFTVADAIKHDGIFTGSLLGTDPAALTQTREQIISAITLLVKGIGADTK